jgi:hypothetical protein
LLILLGAVHSTYAQVSFVVPAWQPITPRVQIFAAMPAVRVERVPTTIERYYFVPSVPGVQGVPDSSATSKPPAHSTDEPLVPPVVPMTERTGAKRRIIIREYFIPADPAQATERSINEIPIPTDMPRKLSTPPWSDDFEKKPSPARQET